MKRRLIDLLERLVKSLLPGPSAPREDSWTKEARERSEALRKAAWKPRLCGACGVELAGLSKVCGECGWREGGPGPKPCPHCGRMNSPNAPRCGPCGKRLA